MRVKSPLKLLISVLNRSWTNLSVHSGRKMDEFKKKFARRYPDRRYPVHCVRTDAEEFFTPSIPLQIAQQIVITQISFPKISRNRNRLRNLFEWVYRGYPAPDMNRSRYCKKRLNLRCCVPMIRFFSFKHSSTAELEGRLPVGFSSLTKRYT